jgi:hypothetical protein
MRLIDFVFRPIKTSRLILRLMRESEVNVEFKPKRKSKLDEKMSEFVVLGHYYMMPASSLKLIEDTIVRVDSNGYGDNKIWHRVKDQELTIQKVSFAQAVAMCVNEKLEAANGN